MDHSKVRHALSFTTVVLGVCISACSPRVPTGSGYPPVSKEMLIGTTYSHRTGREDWNLTWTFSETEFVIKAVGESLPPDLVEAIAGTQQAAKQLNGTWDLLDESLLISKVKIDEETEVAGERSTRIFFTGVIRVQTLGAQYVFEQAMTKKN